MKGMTRWGTEFQVIEDNSNKSLYKVKVSSKNKSN